MWCKMVVVTALLLVLSDHTEAQSSSEILLNIRKLEKTGSVLYIAAHPDDENTRLLAYLANERKVRTGYLSLTRGDGGQNLIGDEQGIALGIIRTHELMQARAIDRAEQFFTRAYDFGYSKNPEETFRFWNRDSVLADVVWVIRNFKPDVIICRFPTTGEGGHGHHTASAMLAEEAFDAAADPSRFPWQLKYTEPWQAKRLFWNTFNFGGNNTVSEDQLKVDVGNFNQLMGRSYGEIASLSRSMHKSQGFGSASQRGINYEYFKQLKGEPVTADLFDGIDINWTRITQSNGIAQAIRDLIYHFRPDDPALSIPQLIGIRKLIRELPDDPASVEYWKKRKLEEVDKLVFDCAGIFAEALAPDYFGVKGDEMEITTSVIKRNETGVVLRKIEFDRLSDTLVETSLKFNELNNFKRKILLTREKATIPYWTAEGNSRGEFFIPDLLKMGKPLNDPALQVTCLFEVMGEEISMTIPVRYKYTDPVKGEQYRSFEIVPAYSVTPEFGSLVFNTIAPKTLEYKVKAFRPGSVKPEIHTPEGWKCSADQETIVFDKRGQEKTIRVTVTPQGSFGTASLEVSVSDGKEKFSSSVRYLDYDHIPRQLMSFSSDVKLVYTSLTLGKRKIGYVEGAGDLVDESLIKVGYDLTYLTVEDIAKQKLEQWDAVITGVRAYNTNEELAGVQERLLEYVKNGGNLIIQYNTNSRVGPLNFNLGPYPFTISRNRVTNEESPVKLVNPGDEIWNVPNKIGEQDFEDWVQERGIYFVTEADNRYAKPLLMNDEGEAEQDGALIYVKYGKGYFVYTGLAFFRELPAGVPGAYRIMANLIDLGK